MRPFAFMDHRVRGFRVVEVGALSVLLILILAVYLSKTGAGTKRADIQHVQTQIDDEQIQIRLLRAEVATLEQPERLEDLASKYLGLAPISARREITAAALSDVARVAEVGQHQTVVVNDPLTAKGSPDVVVDPAAPAAAPATAATATTATPASIRPAAAAPATIKVATATPPHTAAAPVRETR